MRYACDEAQNKLSETWDSSEWTVSAPKDIPKQLNGCDCGVFMLKYADWVVRFPVPVAYFMHPHSDGAAWCPRHAMRRSASRKRTCRISAGASSLKS